VPLNLRRVVSGRAGVASSNPIVENGSSMKKPLPAAGMELPFFRQRTIQEELQMP
jgi:hypothetical protein